MDVLPSDPRWPAHYIAEAERLRAAFGPALREMEHVGSTSVPGLAAKPVIDIMAAVESLPEAEARLPALNELGYVVVPTDMPMRLFLQRAATEDLLATNLHIVTQASWPRRKERLFRDRLIAHPEEAAAYGELKRVLIGQFDDLGAYTRAKTALIQEIMDRAADETGSPRESVWEE
jgi:GrpB-like predicted nucleotidyltransferase (UPF0157 family)